MGGDLGTEQVRVTVRLPKALYDELSALFPSGADAGHSRGASWLLRKALTHYLRCPQRVQADTGAHNDILARLSSR
jgi:hypothetical protein